MLDIAGTESPQVWLADPFCHITRQMPYKKVFVGGGCITQRLTTGKVDMCNLYIRDWGCLDTVKNLVGSTPKVKLNILNVYPTVEEFLNKQVFTIECVVIADQQVMVHPDYYLDCARRYVRLTDSNITDPLSVMNRAINYTRLGYTIDPALVNKLMSNNLTKSSEAHVNKVSDAIRKLNDSLRSDCEKFDT